MKNTQKLGRATYYETVYEMYLKNVLKRFIFYGLLKFARLAIRFCIICLLIHWFIFLFMFKFKFGFNKIIQQMWLIFHNANGLVLVSLTYFTPCSSVSNVNFERVNIDWNGAILLPQNFSQKVLVSHIQNTVKQMFAGVLNTLLCYIV